MAKNLNKYTARKWRKKGDYHVETTESTFQMRGGLPRSSDLFGFVDMLLVPRDNLPWIFVQVTSWNHVPTRLKKIRTGVLKGGSQFEIPMRELASRILQRGDKLLIEGWRKKNNRYESREHWVTMEDLDDPAET